MLPRPPLAPIRAELAGSPRPRPRPGRQSWGSQDPGRWRRPRRRGSFEAPGPGSPGWGTALGRRAGGGSLGRRTVAGLGRSWGRGPAAGRSRPPRRVGASGQGRPATGRRGVGVGPATIGTGGSATAAPGVLGRRRWAQTPATTGGRRRRAVLGRRSGRVRGGGPGFPSPKGGGPH